MFLKIFLMLVIAVKSADLNPAEVCGKKIPKKIANATNWLKPRFKLVQGKTGLVCALIWQTNRVERSFKTDPLKMCLFNKPDNGHFADRKFKNSTFVLNEDELLIHCDESFF
ncbi:hypothetical protein MHBO_000702 [Bonamia ostreae]|uniref:Uncharacterized protein n=1 Tax=Bonamia ostreae TaxID=126728 RepID=A0ABV2AGI4_9EUKA